AASAELFVNNRGACRATLSELAADLNQVVTFVVLNADATVRCANRPGLAGRQTRAAPLIARALRSDDVAVGFEPGPLLEDEPVLGMLARANTTPPLFVAVGYPVRLLLQKAQVANDRVGSFVALTDRSAGILAHAGESPVDMRLSAIDDLARATGAFRVGDLW